MSMLRSRKLLGTRIHCVTYESALEEIQRLAGENRPSAVAACNTHLLAQARHDASFHEVLNGFDLVVPDGYPLVWKLKRMGEFLPDRVYGPYLMKHALKHTPAPWKHFFFGGTPECLERLTQSARVLNPDIHIAGVFSPPYRAWSEADEEEFAARIRESGADFIWVALGGERQERWIARNIHRHQRGVFLAVGDAFELLAGNRSFAPQWMQKRGLTWLHRLSQEPSRLWGRYFRYNSLFLYYNTRDAIFPVPARCRDPKERRPLKIAFLGSRGVPARYSGFEVVVEHLGSRLAKRGYSVTVYNRYPRFQWPSKIYEGMRTITLPTIPTKNLDTIGHTFLSALHAFFCGYDIIYLCGVGNAIIGGLLRACGYSVVINVDGADFRRAKWGSLARIWLKMSERWATRLADAIIADNREIVTRYQREYGVKPLYLSYGCIIRETPVQCGELEHWGLKPHEYFLFVSRLTPENEAELLLEAFALAKTDLKLVICGGVNYELSYFKKLQSLGGDRVVFTGARYGDSYLELSQNALCFVMPACIEATRLVLLDQMGMGSAILYRDCPATREVVGEAAIPFAFEDSTSALARRIEELSADPAHCSEVGEKALARAKALFDWNKVVNDYEGLFAEILHRSPLLPERP